MTTGRTFPILAILGIVFVTLKLLDAGAVASWSWWWVTAPFWGPFAIFAALMAGAGLLFGAGVLLIKVDAWWGKRQEKKEENHVAS